MKKIVYVSGSRSDYSLMKQTLTELNKHAELVILATGAHLSQAFGHTIEEIKNDGFNVKKVDMLLDADTPSAMVKSLGIGIYGLSQLIEELDPNLILVEGDRGEALAGAIIGAHSNIPVVHHGGGDLSKSIDNKIRGAITSFSDYHLTGNRKSMQRLTKMGIAKERIRCVGEPGLDDIYSSNYTAAKDIREKFGLSSMKPLILLLQHPNTEEYAAVDAQIKATLAAIDDFDVQTIAFYSNSDAGGREINAELKAKSAGNPYFKLCSHLDRSDFLGLMNVCDVMVGNSSSGLVELVSFKKPFVCIGTRQSGRMRTRNTIEVDYNADEIAAALRRALFDNHFKASLEDIKNPYGHGDSSIQICRIVIGILYARNEKSNQKAFLG